MARLLFVGIALLAVVALCGVNAAYRTGERSKMSLDSSPGLIPFPRIGRNPYMSLHTLPIAKLIESLMHDSDSMALLNSFLIANQNVRNQKTNWPAVYRSHFQRVSRSGEKKDLATGNMWFGPRLGKKSITYESPSGSSSSSKDGSKRQITSGLMPFPRNGRSVQKGPKRNGASASGGLWFGPRLGKRDRQPTDIFLLPSEWHQAPNSYEQQERDDKESGFSVSLMDEEYDAKQ